MSEGGQGAVCCFATRRIALETLRKIGKSIVLSTGDTLQHEVHQHFQWDTSIEDGMRDIIDGMDEEERAEMLRWNDGREEWRDKLLELRSLEKRQCCFPGLDEVVELLLDGDKSEDDDDEDDDDQEEDNSEQSEDGTRDLDKEEDDFFASFNSCGVQISSRSR